MPKIWLLVVDILFLTANNAPADPFRRRPLYFPDFYFFIYFLLLFFIIYYSFIFIIGL